MEQITQTTEKIKLLRERLNMKQHGLASAIGVDQATVSRWENGESKPSGPAMKMIDLLLSEAPVEAAE